LHGRLAYRVTLSSSSYLRIEERELEAVVCHDVDKRLWGWLGHAGQRVESRESPLEESHTAGGL